MINLKTFLNPYYNQMFCYNYYDSKETSFPNFFLNWIINDFIYNLEFQQFLLFI